MRIAEWLASRRVRGALLLFAAFAGGIGLRVGYSLWRSGSDLAGGAQSSHKQLGGEARSQPMPLPKSEGAGPGGLSSARVAATPAALVVGLDGVMKRPMLPAASNTNWVYAQAARAWVHAEPRREGARLGYLRAGAAVAMKSEPRAGQGCAKGWVAIEPRGYVCIGRDATLDKNDPVVRITRTRRPRLERKLPYIYGTVRRPGPIYAQLPSPESLKAHEPSLDKRMPRWLEAGGEIGASYAQHVWKWGNKLELKPVEAWEQKRSEPLPAFLAAGQQLPRLIGKGGSPRVTSVKWGRMRPRVGHAFVETYLHEGRRYGLSTELTLLPTDRLRPIQGSSFHGVNIGKGVQFPFAFVRRIRAHYYRIQGGKLVRGEAAAYRSVVKLTGKQRFFGRRLHYQTQDDRWLSDQAASRLDSVRRLPAWGKRGERWIDVNISKQTLVLYEGARAVYATLVSTGEAGLDSAETTTATKRGIFRIHTKHISATMSSREVGEEFELKDVPYVQYFDQGGLALHGAYWHDRFGTPKSHGCINLSPEDARRIFHWTRPQVPPHWHGALLALRGTTIFIHP